MLEIICLFNLAVNVGIIIYLRSQSQNPIKKTPEVIPEVEKTQKNTNFFSRLYGKY